MVKYEHRSGYKMNALLINCLVSRKVNFLTYKAVISLQTSIPDQLERCWTQEPAILEDALGRVTPLHLEFLDSWEVSWSSLVRCTWRSLTLQRLLKPSLKSASDSYQAIEK